MSQVFSNHLNNYSFDNFTPQVTKDRNADIICILLFAAFAGIVIYHFNKCEKEKKNKSV